MKSKFLILSVVASTLLGHQKTFALDINNNASKEQKIISNEVLDFFPVKFSDLGGKGTLKFEGKHLVKLSKSILIDLQNLNTITRKGGHLNFALKMSDKKSKEFNKLTQKYLNYRLAMVYKGKVLMAPQIKEAINGNAIKFTLKHENKFDQLVNGLNLK
jgi:preprotein translocase subunit SecD